MYHAKVVLAGGISDSTVTDKVWVLQEDNTWNESLPPMPTAWYEAATSSNHFLVSAGMANVICASNIVEIYDGKQWMTMSFLPINCFNPWCTCLNNYCLFCQGKSVLCISIQNSAGSHQTVGLEEGTRYPTLYYLHYHICWYLAWLAWQLVQVFTCIIHWLNSGFHCERLNANYVLYMHCILLIV